MEKLTLQRIANLKIGESVFVLPKMEEFKRKAQPIEYTLIEKNGVIYKFISTSLFKLLEGSGVKESANHKMFEEFSIDYVLGYDGNDFELYEKVDKLADVLKKWKFHLQDFLVDHLEEIKVEINYLSQVGFLAENIMENVEEILRKHEESGERYSVEICLDDVITNMIIEFDSDSDKVRISIKGEEKQPIKEDECDCKNCVYRDDCLMGEDDEKYEDEVDSEFLLENLFNDDFRFKIEHPLFDEIIERAIQFEEEWIDGENERMGDTLHKSLAVFLLDDYRTAGHIIEIMTFYGDNQECNEILGNARIYVKA